MFKKTLVLSMIVAILAMFSVMTTTSFALGTPINKTVAVSAVVPPATTVSEIPAIVITAIPGSPASETSAFTITSSVGGTIAAVVTTEITSTATDVPLTFQIDANAVGADGTFAATGLTTHTLKAFITINAAEPAGPYAGGVITVTVTPAS